MQSINSKRVLHRSFTASNPSQTYAAGGLARPLRSVWQARFIPAIRVHSNQRITPVGDDTSDLAEQSAASADEVQQTDAKGVAKIRRRKNETYEQYKARREKKMMEMYQNLPPQEVERRLKIGQANSKRVPWNKGRKHSPETLEKIRARTKAAMERPEVKEKIKNNHPRPSHTTETKARIGKSVKQAHQEREESLPPEELIAKKEAAKEAKSGSSKKHWDNPDYRERVMAGLRAYHERQKIEREEKAAERKRLIEAGLVEPTWGELSKDERRRIQAQKAKALWADPEWREKTLAATRAYKERLRQEKLASGAKLAKPRNRSGSGKKRAPAAAPAAAADEEEGVVVGKAADVVSTRSSRRGQEGAAADAPSRASRSAASRKQQQQQQQDAAAAHRQQPAQQLTRAELQLLVAKLLKMRQLVARTEMATGVMQRKVSELASDPQEQAAAGAALQHALATLATAKAQLKALEGTIPAGVTFDEAGNILSNPSEAAAPSSSNSSSSSNGVVVAGAAARNGVGPPVSAADVSAAMAALMNKTRNGRSSSSSSASSSNGVMHAAGAPGSPSSNGVYGASPSSSNGVHAAGTSSINDAEDGAQQAAAAAASSSEDASTLDASSNGETAAADSSSNSETTAQQSEEQQEQQQQDSSTPKLRKAGRPKLWLNGKFQSVDESSSS